MQPDTELRASASGPAASGPAVHMENFFRYSRPGNFRDGLAADYQPNE